MNVFRTILHPILALSALFAGSAAAEPHYFSSKEAFDLRADSHLVEDFESFDDRTVLIGTSYSRSGLSYHSLNGNPLLLIADGSAANSDESATSRALTAAGDEDLRIELTTPSRVLALDTFVNQSPVMIELYGSNGLIGRHSFHHDPRRTGFLGIIADEEIHALRWIGGDGRRLTDTGVDNIRIGTVINIAPESAALTPAPLSGSLLLGLAGLTGGVIYSRKRRESPIGARVGLRSQGRHKEPG